MAIWIPRYKVVGGLFAGVTPQGSLSGFAQNLIENFYGTFGSYGSVDSPPSKVWEGAFGSGGDPMLEYGKQHADQGQQTNIPLFELEFKTPPLADFERQTLMVYGSVICDKHEGTYNDEPYLGYNYSFTLSHMTRRYFRNGQWYEESIPTSGSAVIGAGNWVAVSGHDYFDNKYLIEKLYYAVSPFTYNDTEYLGAAIYIEDVSGDGLGMWNGGALISITRATLTQYFGEDEPEEEEDPTEDPDDPNNPPGPNDPTDPGGGGDHDRREDPIPEPDLPSLGAADAGFVTMYVLNKSQMQTFADDLFANPLDPGGAWQNIKALFGDPMDFIVGCMIVPFFPDIGAYYYPKFGLFTWSHSYPTIEEQFQIIDCGSHIIPKYYNTALDYNPMTKVSVWLPFIGYRDLDADEVMGQTVAIKYHVDCLTGDCVAFLIKKTPVYEQVLAQYSGNCAIRVPFGHVSFDAAVQAGIQMLGGAVGFTVSAGQLYAEGGQAGPTSETLSATAKSFTVGSINAMKAHTERSGVAGASAGYMGIMKPYIIRRIPDQSLPAGYKRLVGYPSNVGGLVRNFTGFTAVESIELSGVKATDAEKTEILSMLRGGFII